MTRCKSVIIGILIILVLVIGTIVNMRSHVTPQYSYRHSMPKVGDCGLVLLAVSKLGKIDRGLSDSDYRCVYLRIECDRSCRHTRRFNIRYANTSPKTTPIYFVSVNYETDRLGGLVTVSLPSGQEVLRGQLIDGNPVPFFRLFVFENAFWGKKILHRKDGLYERLRRRSYGDGTWSVGYLLESGKKDGVLSVLHQLWRSDEWLWEESHGEDSGCVWHAVRQSITGVKGKLTGS